MHTQYRNTAIHCVNITVCHEHGNGSAAALVYLTQLTGLPDDTILVECIPHLCHQLCCGIRGTGLAAGTGILYQRYAAVGTGIIALFRYLRIIRVKGVAYIRRQTGGLLNACVKQGAIGTAQISHQRIKEPGLHAGHAIRTDFFLIYENCHGSFLGNLLQIQQGSRCRIRAYPVIMTVSTYERTVKAHV